MKFLPIGINLRGQKILIIGAGAAAAQKIRALRKYTSALTLLAPEIKPVLRRSKYRKIIKPYAAADLTGYKLVYACTDDRRLNQQIARDARRRRILVNVCDDPQHSDFISPAVYKKGFMSAAVFSDGRDVHKSLQWRDKIRSFL
ncbi:MAG: bifunctional precorrin-2 dehydrogenase/sirohydrochlorin ferrochelatase [Candidatus Margulisbacteria bacterium]|jgi:siroheme synthase-like protein|nr:bifunctional precorrin-2 dehydrogenase/sirohydrochlorin ferrochelatase [Candidatus Margulisiibacteriota bacterium]